jgi:Family of unknown function (DUF6325)
MGSQCDVVLAEHASELALHVPQRRQALDGFELQHGDRVLPVPDQDDEVEDADLAGLHELGQRRHDGRQRVLIRGHDHHVLDEVGRDAMGAVGRLSCVSHLMATTPLLRAQCGDHDSTMGRRGPPRGGWGRVTPSAANMATIERRLEKELIDMENVDAGPIDVVFLRFPGNQFNGAIAPALRDLVAGGLVRVIDLLFVYKDVDGTVGSLELGGLGSDLEPSFVDLDGQLGGGLLDAEDVGEVAAGIEPGNSIAVIAVENLWAVPFINAVRSAGGELVDQARVPSDVVDAVRRAADQGG